MLKRLFLMIILVLATAFTVVLTSTGIGIDALLSLPGEIISEGTTVPVLPTQVIIEPEVTLEPTAMVLPTLEPTLLPSATPLPTPTLVPTATLPAPTPTAVPFNVQQMTPVYMTNFAHPDAACNWQGVAGQVFDAQGTPILNYIVKITGIYNSVPFSAYGITGMANAMVYGHGGYEIVLGNVPTVNVDTLTIQLFDSDGNVQSEPMKLSTSKECSQNLVIVNFSAR